MAYAYPLEFLKGLYDSEGSVSPQMDNKRRALKSAIVFFTVGDGEVKEVAKTILSRLGLEPVEEYEPPEVRVIDGRVCEFNGRWELYFYGWDNLELFATIVGFREGKRRRRLELLLRIRHMPPWLRYRIWTGLYIKKNGRWVEKTTKRPPRAQPNNQNA